MIEVRGLHKRFGAVTALDGVDVSFPDGTVSGIVGPNSAGKTTLLKSILGLVRPDGGIITMDGRPLNPAARSRIGFMRQTPSYPDNLTPAELFRMLQRLRPGVTADESLVREMRLEPDLRKPMRTLSGGTRQKVNAVIAFMFDPAVLILDEPTAGLDPVASRVLKRRVRRARDEGRAVLLTSHVLSELQDLADRLLVVVEGKVRFSGSAAELAVVTGADSFEDTMARLLETP
jgi:Cu-processing system ATP-binding protein